MISTGVCSIPPLLDVRSESAFLTGHVAGAVGIPLEELPARAHELPPRGTRFAVADADLARAEEAARLLRERGHVVTVAAFASLGLTENGPARTRLWRPNPFLIEALARIDGDRGTMPTARGRALDVACGSGRDAVWLALAGYDVEAVDLLPDALERADDLARRSGVKIRTIERDLENDPTLPVSRYQLICVFRYLQRDLFPALREAVAPGGYIICETFHEKNRQTGRRPLSSDHLLRDGELTAAFTGFEFLIARDGLERDGRYFCGLLARRTR